MSGVVLTHVTFGNDYGKVHRLTTATTSLLAKGLRTACGRAYRASAGAAGYDGYDEARYGMCERCRKVTT